MSRAAWAGILLLGAGLGLAAYFLTRGIEASTLEAVKAAEQAVEGDAASLERAHGDFVRIVGQAPDYLEGQPDIAAARKDFEARRAKMAEAKAVLTEQIPPLIESGDYENNDRVVMLAQKAAATSSQAVGGVSKNAGTARRLLRYKTDHATLMQTARAQVTAAASLGAEGDTALENQIQLAATRYPEAKPKLDARLTDMKRHAAQIAKSGADLERLAAAASIDYVAAGKTADAVIQGGDKLAKMRADIESDIADLGKSVDKILEDMKEENGRYYHQYKVVENGVARTTGWEEVTRSVYQQHREHLGMAIYSKPEGKLASEAETVAAPPGYNYVGNERYGRWERRNGQEFWVFYGKYSLMRDLLWGGGGRYRSVPRTSYRSYRSTIGSGKPFYGTKKQYGSKGTVTKTRYSGSNYYKQQRRSKYSGSKYSGSRRSSSRRYSGSSSGGRRSGGSRGSRYRSSSFGGGGK